MGNITDNGYALKTQNEWFEDEEALYKSIDPNWNTDASAPDGIKIASDAENFSNLDEVAQRAYNSKDPAKAKGLDLRTLSAITGTIPGDGSPSSVTLTLGGDNGALILAGSRVENIINGSVWITDTDATIVSVSIDVSASSEEIGAIEASAGDISKILTAASGWLSVTNATPAATGSNPDSNAELRQKRTAGVSLPGSNQVDNLFAVVANVDDVRRVVIYENEEGVPINEGSLVLPPHSTTTIIDGGLSQAIGEAMYTKKNPGCKQNQTSNPINVNVVSPVTGNTKVMKFSRPDYIDIIIALDVKDDGTLPSSPQIEDEITQAIIDYVGGDLDLGDGFNQTGFGIGDDVPAGRLYTPVNHVIGGYGNSYIVTLTVGGGSLVAIDAAELSQFTSVNIAVVIS